jgi:hypothetical protein
LQKIDADPYDVSDKDVECVIGVGRYYRWPEEAIEAFSPVDDKKKIPRKELWEPIVYQNTVTFQVWINPSDWKWEQIRKWFLNQYDKPALRGEWVPIKFKNVKTGRFWNVTRKERVDD